MNWDRSFDDLLNEASYTMRRDIESAAQESAQADFTQVAFTDRLRATHHRVLAVWTHSGGPLQGTVEVVNEAYLVLHDEHHCYTVIPTYAIVAVSSLGYALPPEKSRIKPTFSQFLRTLAENSTSLTLVTLSTEFQGKISRVGCDHCDFLKGGAADSQRISIALSAIDYLRIRP
ncbi:hypothetical protein [Actinomyces vulturis]|uniref:hypothetical protein n=1 Tax=Actinomyces vulturis TaxID=1857645 RepID=UPI000833D2D8|nr:hypothetical protein [Actinomyces vulturis]